MNRNAVDADPTVRLIDTAEDLEEWRGPLSEFLAGNAGELEPNRLRRELERGPVTFGGGASPIFRLEICSEGAGA